MAAREKGGRVVFIGNIPYGVSEEQICSIFGQVGSVVNFRLVYDKETGRPKGFGFLEYTDADAAASAVRNLNEHDIMGRTLRVDYSNDNGGGKGNQRDQQHGGDGDNGGGRAPPPAHFSAPPQMNGGPPPADPSALPPLPPGVDLPAGVTAPDAISKTLATVPPPQLLEILSQMKNLTNANPAQAAALLAQAPQLGYAIFQALLLLGLVDTSVLGSLIAQSAQAPPPQLQQQQQQPPMPMSMPMPGYQQQPPPPQAQYAPQQQQLPYGQPPPPSSMPPQQQQQQYMQQPPAQQAHYAPTPPVQQQSAYQPPPPQQQQQQQQQAPAMQMAADPAQAALIQQVLAMSREQIMGLEEGPRGQILALRAQFGAPVH
ncbi:hypothetical protein LTR36_000807 [Oleoguttula mirabilis]|uniref:RRM domain-containing protein n=1 Tax=Oleoguttula mirabilis TaxID=1507867 RepID=A0AAV9J3G4_9PEZI|nr:hypothetical protein LTR36_000807 [Oleoguttula mirabilis]